MSTRAFIENLIKTKDVVIFSKSTCPYCVRAKSAIQPITSNVEIVELNILSNGSDIQSELLNITGQRTVPNIFVKGNHVGGCDNTLAAISNGTFMTLLNGPFKN